MRVFVAGATGVIGRRAVDRLVAAGHAVTGVARSGDKAALLESLGATPVEVDLFDADAVRDAVAGHDAVVNLATHIPPLSQMARGSAWAENERIRREASGHLVDAALAARASVFVQESIAFLYGDHGDEWIDAASTSGPGTASHADAVATAEANAERFSAHGGRGVVLRFGRFYAADSDQASTIMHSARRGLLLDVGAPDAYAPMVDVDDAAAAVVAALRAPAGVYDVTDDDPPTRRDEAAALAAAVGRRRLRRSPSWLTPSSAGPLADSQRVSNRRFRDATGWVPRSPTVREGFAKLARECGVEPVLRLHVRLMLWLLVLTGASVGVQAAFFPRSFYDDFPMGRGWVALDGPFNEHLVRDVGALNLALAFVAAAALFVGTRTIARVAATSWLVYSVPHLVYHSRHFDLPLSGFEQVAVVVSLSVPVIAALVVLFEPRRALPVPHVSPRDAATRHLTTAGASR